MCSFLHCIQIWYDDPVSLSQKYRLARDQFVLGIAFWNIDQLNYEDDKGSDELRRDMWLAIEALFSWP